MHTHWYYFCALREDLERTLRYVEPSQDNFGTYSIEYARLYLSIASEVDVVAKMLCKRVNPSVSLTGINSYRPVILNGFPDLPDVEVVFNRNPFTLTPWKVWATGANPDWWTFYNKVKHQRDSHFKEANLGNTVHALGGLLILVGYLYAEDLRECELESSSRGIISFHQKHFSGTSMGWKGFRMGYRLPGITRSPSTEAALKRLKSK